jgi:CheY-like chemotaxis protein
MAAKRILVVDDDLDMREAIRDTLSDAGYETIEVSDGQSALDFLRANPVPAVILLDWNMAPMSGQELMKQIEGDPILAKIPVVLLTADARAPEKSEGSRHVDCLMKPVDLRTLFEILERYCR